MTGSWSSIRPICKGSHNCIEACPYQGVIFFNEDLNIAQKCTFCAHLLDKGWTDTRCSEVCPTGAFTFGEEEDLADLIAKAEVLHPEFGAKPRVYYIGLPKTFIAGTVYDPEADEIVEGALVTLTARRMVPRRPRSPTSSATSGGWAGAGDVSRVHPETGLRGERDGTDRGGERHQPRRHSHGQHRGVSVMRAIVNIMTGSASAAAGWRAREVKVAAETASLGDILRSVYLKDGTTSLFDLIADDEGAQARLRGVRQRRAGAGRS